MIRFTMPAEVLDYLEKNWGRRCPPVLAPRTFIARSMRIFADSCPRAPAPVPLVRCRLRDGDTADAPGAAAPSSVSRAPTRQTYRHRRSHYRARLICPFTDRDGRSASGDTTFLADVTAAILARRECGVLSCTASGHMFATAAAGRARQRRSRSALGHAPKGHEDASLRGRGPTVPGGPNREAPPSLDGPDPAPVTPFRQAAVQGTAAGHDHGRGESTRIGASAESVA